MHACIDLEYDNPYMNLAVEEAIFISVGMGISPCTLRFWQNSKPVVVLGRFQCEDLEINSKACRKYGVTIVRRFTGGGTVYHDDGNLNYAISICKERPMTSSFESLKLFSKGVIEGLRILGLNAKFVPPGSIQINKGKISGLAAAIKRGAVFYHGTLLANSSLSVLSEVLDVPKLDTKNKCVRSVPTKVTNLQDELGRKLSMLEVKQALKQGFEKVYNIKFVRGGLSSEERILAQKLHKENLR